MYRDFFARSPALAPPVIALMLFLTVFIAVVFVAWRRAAESVARDANLPFDDSEDLSP